MTITIQTGRLSIVPFTRKHISDEYISWLNNKQLMRFSEQRHKAHNADSCLAYMRSYEGTSNYFFAIEMQDEANTHIGTITVYHDIHNRIVDIGIMIGSPIARGRGLGKEAWNAAINWVVRKINPRKITAGAMSENIPMISIMEQSGMVPDGVRKKHYLLDGKEIDIVYMAIFVPGSSEG